VSGGAPGQGRGRWFRAGVAAVIALAALARLARYREALWGQEVVPVEGDALYHLRRALDVAAGRGLPTFDPQINWPHGGPVPWAPGFDLLGGGLAWLAGGPSAHGASLAVALLPVGLGLCVVAVAMALAFRAAPAAARRPAALAAGLLAALLPQGVYCSRFALTDHHVVEALLLGALALWTQRGVGAGGRPAARFELAGAALSAAGVLFFTGAPLYVALAAAPLAAAALLRPAPAALVGSGAPGLLAGGLLSALLSVPLVASNGRPLSFAFPSYLQPALVLLAGAGVAAAVAASRAGALRRRLAVAALLGLCALGLAAAVPGLAAQVAAGVRGWLLARDPWLAAIDEFQAVWSPAIGLRRAHLLWGVAGLALPALALVAARARWAEDRGSAAALLFQALAAAALAALEIRFGRAAVPVLAAAGGVALAALAARLPLRPALAGALAPAVAALALAADPPVWKATSEARLDRSAPVVAAALSLRWSGTGEEAPGVLAPWDQGHQVNVIGRRPVVANGFGTYLDAAGFEEVARAWSLPEPELARWMESRRLGHVVAGLVTFEDRVPGPGSGGPIVHRGAAGALDLDYLRGVPLAAAILGGSGLPDAGVHHLERLMPRFASLQIAAELPFALPLLWTYELVEGARLGGRAPAGARVVLELDLAERGRPHVWRAWTTAGADGRWTLRVPLPTGLATPTLSTRPAARLRAGGAPVAVEIPEAAVRGGAAIEVDVPGP
jgi:asparagine N-glycosylation enzyme membrane subunit Stt3